jgi:hypothetical protein
LGLSRSAAKTPDSAIGFAWISLDSFVRIETFQWVAADFRAKVFRHALSPGVEGRREPAAERKGGNGHAPSLIRFLLFRNQWAENSAQAMPRRPVEAWRV